MKSRIAPPPAIAEGLGRAVRRGALAMTIGIVTCFAGPTLASATTDSSARFVVQAELRPLSVSADGRFAVDARARHAPETKSADGRFVLKAVHVPEGGCEAFPDPLFSNGFEGP